jgi:hypothetical protein
VLGVALLSVAAAVAAAAGIDRLLAALAVRRAASRVSALLGAGPSGTERDSPGPGSAGRGSAGRGSLGHRSPGSAATVRIVGVPFLTQLAAGVYREVEVTLECFTAGGIEFRTCTMRLRRVRAPLRLLLAGRGLVAGQVSALTTIPFSALTSRLPPGLVVRRQGAELRVSGSMLLMPVTGTLAISADRQRISVVPKVLGVPSLMAFVIGLPGLPPELTIDSLQVTDVGLEITLCGEDVNLTPH